MTRNDIYSELKEAVINFVSRESDPSAQFDIEMVVEKYFAEEISLYSPEELARVAGTPEKIIRHFKKYLSDQNIS